MRELKPHQNVTVRTADGTEHHGYLFAATPVEHVPNPNGLQVVSTYRVAIQFYEDTVAPSRVEPVPVKVGERIVGTATMQPDGTTDIALTDPTFAMKLRACND